MQWLSLLFSFFLGKFKTSRPSGLNFKESLNLLFDEIAYRSRKPAMFTLGGLVCVTLLCGGFFMGLIDLTNQFDREGSVRATAGNITGFALAAIAIGIFTWIFKRAWPGVKEVAKTEEASKENPSGLEQALTLLVMDYIKEREFKREERRQQHHVPVPEKEPSSPLYNN